MSNQVAICPFCGEELEVEKVLDTEHCGSDAVLLCEGHCTGCDKNFQWEDVFILQESRYVKEI